MLLILEEYFKDHPIKKRIVEGLYQRGISVNDGKFYIDTIELSVSEVAKSFKVNRRTVYDTLAIIDSTPGVKEIMSRLRASPDIRNVAPLLGDNVVTISICPGYFSKVMANLMDSVKKYGPYIKEIYGRNHGRDEVFLRAIFYKTVPRKIFDEISGIEGVKEISIDYPSLLENEIICNKCDVKTCPSKLSSGINEETIAEF